MSSRPPMRLAGRFAWTSGGRIVAALLQSALLIIAARAVSPAEFGVLASVLGVATVVQTAVDMGVSTFVTRERAAHPESGAIPAALRFNAVTSVIMAVLSAGLLTALGSISSSYYLLLPLAIWISAERTADVRLTIAFADGDVKINTVNLITRRTASIAIFSVLLLLGVEPLLAYACSVALSGFGSSVFANAYVKRRVTVPASIGFRELLTRTWPYWVHSVATQLRNLDSAITAVVAGPVQAGFFSVASRLTSPLRILPTTMSNVLLPSAARATAKGTGMGSLARLALASVGVAVVVYGAILIVVPWGLPLVLGEQYTSSVPSVMVVVAGLPFAAAVSLYSSLLQGAGRKHFVATVSTTSAAVCLTAVAVLGWVFGAVGAASALTITFALQAVAIVVGFAVLVMRHQGDGTPGDLTDPELTDEEGELEP